MTTDTATAAVEYDEFHSWMPEFAAPWEADGLPAPREEYAAGVWAYALGRPACEHPRYGAAVDAARAAGWNPWWIRSWGDVAAVLDGCYVDLEAGLRTCEFLEMLVCGKAEWRNKALSLHDWERYDLIIPVYGWQAFDGLRRYTRAGIWIPKKQGKSLLCSGLGLYHLRGDREGGAHVWVASTDRDQAGIVVDESIRMVKLTPMLSDDLRPIEYRKRIVYDRTDGLLEALSEEVYKKEGLDWSAGICDELHVFDRKTWGTLVGGGAARRQPLLITISTAGEYDPLSIGWEQWEVAKKIRSGMLLDSSQFALQYYADEAADMTDPAVWRRCNPSLGLTCKERYMRERIAYAQESPAKLAEVKRYNGNIWVNAASAAISQHVWQAAAAEGAPLEIIARWLEEMAGEACWMGIDMSLSDDLSCVGLWFKPNPAKGWTNHRFIPWFWLPAANLFEKARENNAPYQQWAADGLLQTTPGTIVDPGRLRAHIQGLLPNFRIQEGPYDPWNAGQLMMELSEQDGITMVDMRQGFQTMGPACKEFERLLIAGEFEHPNHPILTWMASNVQKAFDRNGNFMWMKSDGRVRLKIDGIVVATMAGYRALLAPDVESVYKSRGFLGLMDGEDAAAPRAEAEHFEEIVE